MADLKSLQFDIYQRYDVLATALAAAFEKPAAPVRVLDLGSGPESLTRSFTSGFEVVAADVGDFGRPDIVTLEPGRPLPFEAGSFDAVVSMDVLEHVLEAQRKAFVAEAARVGADLVVLGFPHADADVREGERLLDAGYLHLWQKHCDFLTEHVEFGLPRHQDAADSLERAGFKTMTLGVCRLDEWLLYSCLDILFLSNFGLGTEKDDLNRRFNEASSTARRPKGHYRAMVIGARSQKVLDRIEAAIFPNGRGEPRDPFDLAWRAFEAASSLVTGLRKKSYQEVYSVVAHDLAQIKAQLVQRAQLEASIADLTSSTTQARDAAVALERRNVELAENFAAISRALAEEQERGKSLAQEVEALRASLAASEEQNARLLREQEALAAQLASLSEERARIIGRVERIAAEHDAVVAARDALAAQRDELSAECTSLVERVDAAERENAALSREVDATRDQLTELASKEATERSRLERTENTLAQHRVALGRLTARLRCERRARLLDIEKIEMLVKRRAS